MKNEFIKMAEYGYKRQAYWTAQGNAKRAQLCLEAAQKYMEWANAESN